MRFALAALLALAACSKSDAPAPAPAPAPAATPTPTAPPAAAKEPASAKQLIASGAVVLDVRTPDEFAGGHVANATNVPVDEVDAKLPQIAELVGKDKSKPVVVYCQAGVRAARAKRMLEQAGYTNVVNGGGYDDLR